MCLLDECSELIRLWAVLAKCGPSSGWNDWNDWECWFPTIIGKTISLNPVDTWCVHWFLLSLQKRFDLTIICEINRSIYFNLGVYTCGVSVQNWFIFGPRWPNVGSLVAKELLKMTENGCLRPSYGKLLTQSNWNLYLVFIWWVFRNDSLLGHVRPSSHQNDWKWWFPTIIGYNHLIQLKLDVYTYLVSRQKWFDLEPRWPKCGPLVTQKWQKMVVSDHYPRN